MAQQEQAVLIQLQLICTTAVRRYYRSRSQFCGEGTALTKAIEVYPLLDAGAISGSI